DCKKALTEANGDFDAAIDPLRKKGQKVSASRSDRETTEGAAFVNTNDSNTDGVIVEHRCETDVVGKNEEFQNHGNALLNVAVEKKPASVDARKGEKIGDQTVEEKIIELVGKIGEKIEIVAYEVLNAEAVVTYIHAGSKLGVLVGLKGANGADVAAAGRDVAMQI